MEPNNFYFDVRDIFRAPRIALSGRKIWLFLKANLFGYAAYWILSTFAIILNGNKVVDVIEKFGLYPCLYSMDERTIISLIFYWTGIIIWLVAITLACTAVSRLTIQQLKGNEQYSVADARKFVNRHKHQVLMSPISILSIAFFFTFGLFIVALIGKIPFVGELIFVILYIAILFAAVFILYTLIVLVVSIVYSPSIIATLEEDTIGTVHQSYSLLWSQPWRLILYNSILIPLVVLSVYIVKLSGIAAYGFINKLFSIDLLMGEKVQNIVGWSTDLILPWSSINTNPLLLSLQNGVGLSISENIAATILAVFLFLIIAIILSYGLAILSVGETIIFTILKMKSDDENLLNRRDKDELFKMNDDPD